MQRYQYFHARCTQKRAHTLDFQSATRYVEGILLGKAYSEIVYHQTGELHYFWGKPEVTKMDSVGGDVIRRRRQ